MSAASAQDNEPANSTESAPNSNETQRWEPPTQQLQTGNVDMPHSAVPSSSDVAAALRGNPHARIAVRAATAVAVAAAVALTGSTLISSSGTTNEIAMTSSRDGEVIVRRVVGPVPETIEEAADPVEDELNETTPAVNPTTTVVVASTTPASETVPESSTPEEPPAADDVTDLATQEEPEEDRERSPLANAPTQVVYIGSESDPTPVALLAALSVADIDLEENLPVAPADVAQQLKDSIFEPGTAVVLNIDVPAGTDPLLISDTIEAALAAVSSPGQIIWVKDSTLDAAGAAILEATQLQYPTRLLVADWASVSENYDGVYDAANTLSAAGNKLRARLITNVILGLPVDALRQTSNDDTEESEEQ
jgi:hypothetical protein